MLAAFPENYVLWEHVKKAEGDGVKSNKTHAGGGNERQDAYLYGHPLGRKKRYRSPADFYPHLYWLATDEAGDSDNCACKICTPEEFDLPLPARKDVKTEAPVKTEAKVPAVVRHPTVVIPRRTSSQDVKSGVLPTPTAGLRGGMQSGPLPPQQQPLLQPSVLPKPAKQDQAIDLAYDMFMFRQGELVWFNRGNAWGLGIINARWRSQSPQPTPHYTVQPLSHPFSHPQPVTVLTDANLRPWLAWSVPSFTCAALNNTRVTYEGADWHGMSGGKYGPGDLEVDGSILAAKAIDSTYTTFDLVSRQERTTGILELHWLGIFLGAEKVWVGDVVRLRAGLGNDVLVLHHIVERSRTSAFNQQVLDQTLHLVGDVYTITEVAMGNTTSLFPQGTDLSNLPRRMVDDIQRRNELSIPTRQVASTWKLTQAAARFEINDIKGRWYEATLLLPVLDAAAYENESKRGDIAEAGLRMNSRHDCHGSQGQLAANVRKAQRSDAFGKAVPSDTRIADGSNPPHAAATAGQVQQQQQVPAQNEQVAIGPAYNDNIAGDVQQDVATDPQLDELAGGGAGLEEFMDLDGIGAEGLPGFGQGYGGNATDQQHLY